MADPGKVTFVMETAGQRSEISPACCAANTDRVACFSLALGNFFMFLSTTVTYVAVVLQFDYKVVRAITKLAAAPSR